jgi:hypothetical protein
LAAVLSEPFSHRPDIPPINASTLRGIRTRTTLNGNIVMTVLRWLGRSPESFVGGCTISDSGARIPDAGPGHLLRWDLVRLDDAIERRQAELGTSRTDVARELGVSPGLLTGLCTRHTVGFPWVMRLVVWLGQPAASFVDDVPV